MQVWDTARGQVLRTFEHTAHVVEICRLSADGRLVLAKCGDRNDPKLRVWDMGCGRMLQTLVEHADAVYDCALNADGTLALATLTDGTLRLWDTASGEEIARWTHEIGLSGCALSADGRLAMAGDPAGDVHFLELVRGAEVRHVSLEAVREGFQPGLRQHGDNGTQAAPPHAPSA